NLKLKVKTIKKLDLLNVNQNYANHYPNQFDDPEIFNITKKKSRHLTFGTGIHTCLGAPLARMEGEIAINSLLNRYPDCKLKVDMDDLDWRPGMVVRGVKELPVTL